MLLWIGWACTIAVLFFMGVIVMFGALTLKAPSWDAEFYALAQYEWARRGLEGRKLSVSEANSKLRLLGSKAAAEKPDFEFHDRMLATVQVLTGSKSRVALKTYVDRRSATLLSAALIDTRDSVREIANVTIASRLWVFRKSVALSMVTARGLVWFVPRYLMQVARSIGRSMSVATILGITGGLLYWGFNRDSAGPGPGGLDWVNFVSLVITIGSVVALVIAIGQQFLRVAVAIAGPARAWSRKAILWVVFVLATVFTMQLLILSGVWEQWQRDAGHFLMEQFSRTPVGDWIGKALFVALVCFAGYRALCWARAKWLRLSDRVSALAAAIVYSFFAALVLLYVFDAPWQVARPVLFACAWAMVTFGVLTVVFAISGWAGKYRELRRLGVDVRRGWFRWWMLWGWFGGILVLTVLDAVPLSVLVGTPFGLPFALTRLLLGVVLFVAFWPGAFSSARFAHRVMKAYEHHQLCASEELFFSVTYGTRTGGPSAKESTPERINT